MAHPLWEYVQQWLPLGTPARIMRLSAQDVRVLRSEPYIKVHAIEVMLAELEQLIIPFERLKVAHGENQQKPFHRWLQTPSLKLGGVSPLSVLIKGPFPHAVRKVRDFGESDRLFEEYKPA